MSVKCGFRLSRGAMLAGVAFVALVSLAMASPAWAATFAVTKTADTNDGACDADCSLREAVIAANAAPGADTITVPAGTYVLTIQGADEDASATGDLDVNGEVTINGAGADATTVSAAGEQVNDAPGIGDRVFEVGDGSVVTNDSDATITNLTVSGGETPFGTTPQSFLGGGILVNRFGNLALNEVVVTGNEADHSGGGIYNDGGATTITDSTVTGNTARFDGGGGVYNANGALTLTGSTVTGNTAFSDGGGVFSDTNPSGKQTTIQNSTISGNTAGGVCNGGGRLTISSATITENSGAGVSSVGLNHSTLTEISSTIISANNPTDVDFPNPIQNSFASGGYNVIGDGKAVGAGNFEATGDQTNVSDPGLGPLQNNGGPTFTHALLPGSPAIDQGDSPGLATDQRGQPRPHDDPNIKNATGGDGSDTGSFESQTNSAPPTLSINDKKVAEGDVGATDATFTVTLSKAIDRRVTVEHATSDRTAKASSDYRATTGGIPFAPGDKKKTITVPVKGDTLHEPDETFAVNLSNSAGAMFSDARGKGTIKDDDEAPARCTITGTPRGDILEGTPRRDVICGLGGNDIIKGFGGSDIVRGGPGNDILHGGSGNDTLVGGPGRDILRGGDGDDRLDSRDGAKGNDLANGGPGRDRCAADE
ncbi:MAG: choice-of-anchor Q domain-containing protein, partial [Rubrobacteraceae bacterium]